MIAGVFIFEGLMSEGLIDVSKASADRNVPKKNSSTNEENEGSDKRLSAMGISVSG